MVFLYSTSQSTLLNKNQEKLKRIVFLMKGVLYWNRAREVLEVGKQNPYGNQVHQILKEKTVAFEHPVLNFFGCLQMALSDRFLIQYGFPPKCSSINSNFPAHLETPIIRTKEHRPLAFPFVDTTPI